MYRLHHPSPDELTQSRFGNANVPANADEADAPLSDQPTWEPHGRTQ